MDVFSKTFCVIRITFSTNQELFQSFQKISCTILQKGWIHQCNIILTILYQSKLWLKCHSHEQTSPIWFCRLHAITDPFRDIRNDRECSKADLHPLMKYIRYSFIALVDLSMALYCDTADYTNTITKQLVIQHYGCWWSSDLISGHQK